MSYSTHFPNPLQGTAIVRLLITSEPNVNQTKTFPRMEDKRRCLVDASERFKPERDHRANELEPITTYSLKEQPNKERDWWEMISLVLVGGASRHLANPKALESTKYALCQCAWVWSKDVRCLSCAPLVHIYMVRRSGIIGCDFHLALMRPL